MPSNKPVHSAIRIGNQLISVLSALLEFSLYLIGSLGAITLFGFYTAVTGVGFIQWITDTTAQPVSEFAILTLLFCTAIATLTYFSYLAITGFSKTRIGHSITTRIPKTFPPAQ